MVINTFSLPIMLLRVKIVRFLFMDIHILKEIDGTYVCNPGSPILPRDKTKGTYLIIKMDESKIDFEFKYL